MKYSVASPSFTKFGLKLHQLFVNKLPAYIIDGTLSVLGQKTYAVKRCKQMLKAVEATEYFMTNGWTFHNKNVQSLHETLCPVDKEVFNFDISQLDWKEYFETYQLGIKKYLLNEPTNQMAESHTSMNRLYLLHCIMRLILLFGTLCIVFCDSAFDMYSCLFAGVLYIISCSHGLLE